MPEQYFNVVVMSSLALQITRTLFGIAEYAAPSTAGKLAFKLFCRTPNPARLSTKEKAAIANAAAFMQSARKHCLTSTYGAFTAYEFRPENRIGKCPTALVVHGWRSRAEHMRVVIEELLERGFRVIAVDLPGHGRSKGRELHIPNAVAALQMVGTWFGPFAIAAGHSFGGAVALNAIAGSVKNIPAIDVARLVLIASPSSLPALFSDFARFVGLGPKTQGVLEGRVETIAGYPLAAYEGGEQLACLNVPTLVIHAPDDKEVPAYNAAAFAESGPHVTVRWAAGLGHRRILADPDIAAAVADFAIGKPRRLAAA